MKISEVFLCLLDAEGYTHIQTAHCVNIKRFDKTGAGNVIFIYF